MKDPAAAALYNSKKKVKVLPRPGVVRPKASAGAEPVAPYISAMPEYKAEYFCDGFVICGCDGVWDEMSSAEAVQVVSELLAKAKAEGDPAANIADQFIEIVMNKVPRPQPFFVCQSPAVLHLLTAVAPMERCSPD